MKHVTRIFPLILALFTAWPALAESPGGPASAPPTQFARIASDAEGRPDALQVAIVTYAGKDDAGDFTVDLVSAVHIGDGAYYEGLNDRFRKYDALLYELIIPEQPDVPQARKGGVDFLSGTQRGLKNLLGLRFQLEEVDYGAANFIHADLTSERLAQVMSERGESLYVYFWRVLYAAIEDYTRDPFGTRNLQRMSGALTSGRGNALKIALAYEMVDATRGGDILGGADGSAVIDARNEHAVRVLKEQLEAGAKHIGIFYGVAHMPDFERRLLNELAIARTGIEWVDAWRFGDGTSPSPTR